jgi:hypothetical protein
MHSNHICYYENIKIINVETSKCRYEVPHKVFEKLRSRFLVHLTSIDTAKDKLPCFRDAGGKPLKVCLLLLEEAVYKFRYDLIKYEGNIGVIRLTSVSMVLGSQNRCSH